MDEKTVLHLKMRIAGGIVFGVFGALEKVEERPKVGLCGARGFIGLSVLEVCPSVCN